MVTMFGYRGQVCSLLNLGYGNPHISIMPTSVTHFFYFRGCKNLTRRAVHKQWGVGISIPPGVLNTHPI